MPKANGVHSTPRRTASKIEAKPAACMTECFLQAKVAAIVVHDTLSDAEPRVTADAAMAVTHAVYQLIADVRALHAQYYEYLDSDAKAVQS
jgi:hypothetical protein